MSVHDSYIAVHGGAGMHSHNAEKGIKQALRIACEEALSCFNGTPAPQKDEQSDSPVCAPLDMVGNAIAVLEDDPLLNAGYGSNLTLHGTVECDAAIMDGLTSDFGSVGAVSGVKSPIRLARAVLEYSKIPDRLGRIPPITLVGEGALTFASSINAQPTIETVPPGSLISPKARGEWTRWKTRLESSNADQTEAASLNDIQDTVGAVACQDANAVAAGVSSGGILLKHPGRIGEAAIFGAGCWAEYFADAGVRIACSISGAGEYIARATLAKAIADAFRLAIARKEDVDAHDILHSVLLNNFWAPCRKRGVTDPNVGVLLLMSEQIEGKTYVRLWCAFTTASMAIAYASSRNPRPKAQILRRPSGMEFRGISEPRIFTTAVPL
ncbi:putative N-terminal nucleophile aminohydrolase [Lyophyllum shimeji]|uniref:N-terminal nucleophile aminohydrolase n=1 Tax=Lyophyllum shimeji TaxID=47721 RepID=A0A9P3UNT6_LYOSH|nr:putative N-terminal nucleophile aminohydrolase [Lyophyllum shimeji]